MVKTLQILNPKSKVNPMPCKFAMFCSVNNLSNELGYLAEFAVKPKWNCYFMNIGRLSNGDDESDKNVSSFQNECAFLKKLIGVYLNYLKMANIGELPFGVLGTTPNCKFGFREEIKFVPVFTSFKQRRKRKFTVVFVQFVRKSAARAKFVVFHLLIGLVSFDVLIAVALPPPSSLLPGFIDVHKPLGIRTRFW